jgi:hypothetical protein
MAMGHVAEEGEVGDVVRRARIGWCLCWEVQVHLEQQRGVGIAVDALQVQVEVRRDRLGDADRSRYLGRLAGQVTGCAHRAAGQPHRLGRP